MNKILIITFLIIIWLFTIYIIDLNFNLEKKYDKLYLKWLDNKILKLEKSNYFYVEKWKLIYEKKNLISKDNIIDNKFYCNKNNKCMIFVLRYR